MGWLAATAVIVVLAGCSKKGRDLNPDAWDGIQAELSQEAAVYFGRSVEVEPLGRTLGGWPCGTAHVEGRYFVVVRTESALVAQSLNSPTARMWGDLCEFNKETPAKSPVALGSAEDHSGDGVHRVADAPDMVAVKSALRTKLKVPGSARLSITTTRAGVSCGLVDAENSFGGRTGNQRFVASGDTVFLEEEMEPGAMDAVWARACRP
ncbi:hypothetical protein [Brevundimonas diminuta]|uniref:hypothetical protein n=1 Tax=Brevundimonas diminuta TaxID=293 RepID=UPI003D9A2E94